MVTFWRDTERVQSMVEESIPGERCSVRIEVCRINRRGNDIIHFSEDDNSERLAGVRESFPSNISKLNDADFSRDLHCLGHQSVRVLEEAPHVSCKVVKDILKWERSCRYQNLPILVLAFACSRVRIESYLQGII